MLTASPLGTATNSCLARIARFSVAAVVSTLVIWFAPWPARYCAGSCTLPESGAVVDATFCRRRIYCGAPLADPDHHAPRIISKRLLRYANNCRARAANCPVYATSLYPALYSTLYESLYCALDVSLSTRDPHPPPPLRGRLT